MNINEYVVEMVHNLELFRDYWISQHEKEPDLFPMEFWKDNIGLWDEMFDIFLKEELPKLKK